MNDEVKLLMLRYDEVRAALDARGDWHDDSELISRTLATASAMVSRAVARRTRRVKGEMIYDGLADLFEGEP